MSSRHSTDFTLGYYKMKKSTNSTTGFTIVELLIVIVVIGILAAITIVAFNGIQNRGKTSSAQSAATGVDKKAEAYNADKGTYPVSSAILTGAASTETFALSGVAFTTTAITAAPTAPATATFYKCGTGAATAAPTTVAGVTTQTGVRIDYWNYQDSVVNSVSAGTTTGLVGTNNIGCVISN